MNKTVYVASHFVRVGKNVIVEIPTGEKKKGIFGDKTITEKVKRWEETGSSDCKVDGPRLAKDIDSAVQALNEEGYEVSTILPVTSGKYDFAHKTSSLGLDQGAGYGYGYGFSYTQGVTIVARKIAPI